MTIEVVSDMIKDALYIIVITAAPLFVPKIISIFIGMMLIGHWMLNNMVQYMIDLWSNFSLYIR